MAPGEFPSFEYYSKHLVHICEPKGFRLWAQTCWCANMLVQEYRKRVDYGNFSTDLNLHISFSDTHSIFIPLSNHTLSSTSARRNSITLWYHQKQCAQRRDLKRIQLISTYSDTPTPRKTPHASTLANRSIDTKIDYYQAENHIRSFNYNTLLSDTSS